MSRVFPAVLLALLWLPWQMSAADSLYPHAGTPTHWFLSLDGDQNGYLDVRELRLRPEWAQAARGVDRNRDARLDHREFLSLLDSVPARR